MRSIYVGDVVAYSSPSGNVTTYRDDPDGIAQRIRDAIRSEHTILWVRDADGTDLPMPIQGSDGRIWVWWKGNLYRDGNGAAVPRSFLA